MGLGGISIWQLLIVLAIVVLLFGTKRLRSLGSDLGGAIKGFKQSINSDQDSTDDESHTANIVATPAEPQSPKDKAESR